MPDTPGMLLIWNLAFFGSGAKSLQYKLREGDGKEGKFYNHVWPQG